MSEFERLKEVIRKLRAPDGCPWDRVQTHETLKAPCIEEAAEVICGINILAETGNAENLQEELGDLLFQVLFHASLAEEEGLFTLEDVARTAADKMVRRHPHVFGDAPGAACAGEAEDAPGAACAGETEDVLSAACAEGASRSAAIEKSGTSPRSSEEEKRAWEEIKKAEKKGREWQEPYLAAAMEEAKELIDVAERRKGFVKAKQEGFMQ